MSTCQVRVALRLTIRLRTRNHLAVFIVASSPFELQAHRLLRADHIQIRVNLRAKFLLSGVELQPLHCSIYPNAFRSCQVMLGIHDLF